MNIRMDKSTEASTEASKVDGILQQQRLNHVFDGENGFGTTKKVWSTQNLEVYHYKLDLQKLFVIYGYKLDLQKLTVILSKYCRNAFRIGILEF